jgi:predicted ATP-dependent endonuclease of OLD family
MNNFRKFRETNNTIEFVWASDYSKDKDEYNKIDIAPKTTLIIGKNNSGKTTVISCLEKLIKGGRFCSLDFNFNYLKELLQLYTLDYLEDTEHIKVPIISFNITVSMDNNTDDILTNIIPFMSIEDASKSEIDINIKWTISNTEIFIDELKTFISKDFKGQKFDRFLDLINKSDFEISYYNSNDEKKTGFTLNNLIEITSISANKIINNTCLSNAFSKIVNYRYKNVVDTKITDELDNSIIDINETLTKNITENHTKNINNSIGQMLSGDKCRVLLKSDLSFQKLIQNVLTYEYMELENSIPENQFGLGYTSLMMIVAEIITYIEKYPTTSFNSQINIIAIEEPETYMHPQMQELFIKNINDMISSLLESGNKHVNSQIIITTHSAHVLNSKIHMGKKIDNIVYITNSKNCATAICLNDNIVLEKLISSKKKSDDKLQITKNEKVPETEEQIARDAVEAKVRRTKELDNLMFLKKHMKFKVSEMFFADAVIFVEGITEYTLLQYYISQNHKLNKHYISVFLVDGAHAKVYEGLINMLSIPTLIITDIDIKRAKWERNEEDKAHPEKPRNYQQVDESNLKDRSTTNNTLVYFYGSNKIEDIIASKYMINENLMVISQIKSIHNYYPTSFEEAFILKNYRNEMLHKVLKQIKPQIYSAIVEDEGVLKNSYKFQCKLSNDKSDFANALLYEILTCGDDALIPELPNYITDGINFLQEKLEAK